VLTIIITVQRATKRYKS